VKRWDVGDMLGFAVCAVLAGSLVALSVAYCVHVFMYVSCGA
jgi:hypothetical protein